MAADLAVVIGCYLAAHWARVWMWRSGYPVLPIFRADVNSWIIIVAFAAWMIAGRYFSLYDPGTYKSVSRLLAASFKAQILAAVLMLNTIFVLRGFRGVSRPLLVVLVLFSFLSSAIEKLIVVLVMRYRRRFSRPATAWRVLLVGSPEDAESYLDLARKHPEWNLEIVGVIPATPNNAPEARVSGDLYSTTQR